MQIAKLIADLLQTASIIMAALMAAYGLDEWRREFSWKRRAELAEEALTLFYQAKDAIAAIRSPMGYVGEGQTRQPAPNERPEDKDALDHAYSLIERYQKHSELFSKIHAMRYRFMAQHGPDAAAPFDQLNEIQSELIIAARQKARLVTTGRKMLRQEDIDRYNDEWMRVDKVFYAGDPDDPIAPKVDEAVALMENRCRAIIESRGTLFSFLNRPVFSRRGSVRGSEGAPLSSAKTE